MYDPHTNNQIIKHPRQEIQIAKSTSMVHKLLKKKDNQNRKDTHYNTNISYQLNIQIPRLKIYNHLKINVKWHKHNNQQITIAINKSKPPITNSNNNKKSLMNN